MILIINSAGVLDYSFKEATKHTIEPDWKILPYGPAVVIKNLRDNGFKTKLLDLRNVVSPILKKIPTLKNFQDYLEHGQTSKAIQEYIEKSMKSINDLVLLEKVKVIGISVFSWYNYHYALVLSKYLKNNYNNLKICFGGPYITLENLNLPEYVDFFLKGASKYNFIALLNHLINGTELEKDINGVVDKNKALCYTYSHLSADEEDFPDYSDLNLDNYLNQNVSGIYNPGKPFLIFPYRISLGCSNNCSFCEARTINTISYKKTSKIIEDLKEIQKLGDNIFIRFTDDSLNSDAKKLDEVLDFIIESKMKVKFWAYLKFKGMDPKLIKKLKKAGCAIVYWGLESFSPKMIKIYNKNLNLVHTTTILKESSKIGINNRVALIVNGPGELCEDFYLTLKNVKKLLNEKNIYFVFNYFRLEPKSNMYHNPEKFGITIDHHIDLKDIYYHEGIRYYENGLSPGEFAERWQKVTFQYEKLKSFASKIERFTLLRPVFPIGLLYLLHNFYYFIYRLMKKPNYLRHFPCKEIEISIDGI